MEIMRVPKEYIQVEFSLKNYGIDTKKRADIIGEKQVYEWYEPLLEIECKAKNVELTVKVKSKQEITVKNYTVDMWQFAMAYTLLFINMMKGKRGTMK